MRNIKQLTGLALKALKHKLTGQRLRLVTIEVTKRCNAQCVFCDYWQEEPGKELKDYSDIVKHFDPLIVTLSGGEPLLRKDIVDIIKSIRKASPVVVISMVTNGALLTIEKAKLLHEAGLNQLSISLDYDGEEHDRVRVLPGVTKKIKGMLKGLSEVGFDLVSLNAVIKDDNLDEIPKIIDLAQANNIAVGLSSYSDMKNGKKEYNIKKEHIEKLKELIAYVKAHRKKYKVVKSSTYYLDHVVDYFMNKKILGCMAGINWVQVTPAGEIKACSEFPVCEKNYKIYNPKKAKKMDCSSCWFSCRGEAQAPVNLERLKDIW